LHVTIGAIMHFLLRALCALIIEGEINHVLRASHINARLNLTIP